MKKVYVLAPQESWIVDRFCKEWNEDNSDISVTDVHKADVVWLMADWCWATHLPGYVLYGRKVITTIHHIVPEKFSEASQQDFRQRDRYTTVYHVPNKHTEAFIRPLTQKPIHVIPYWANQKIWRPTGQKYALRQKYNLPINAFFFGSFQRDTEGHDLKSPKLEKGPDLLADLIIRAYEGGKEDKEAGRIRIAGHGPAARDFHVILAGWRRQYLISRLEAAGVSYSYFEKPSQETINELYQMLDLYPVTARHEGGPQSLLECGLLDVPVISLDVGMASSVLSDASVKSNFEELYMKAKAEVPNVEHLKLPQGYKAYRELIASL